MAKYESETKESGENISVIRYQKKGNDEGGWLAAVMAGEKRRNISENIGGGERRISMAENKEEIRRK